MSLYRDDVVVSPYSSKIGVTVSVGDPDEWNDFLFEISPEVLDQMSALSSGEKLSALIQPGAKISTFWEEVDGVSHFFITLKQACDFGGHITDHVKVPYSDLIKKKG